VARTRKVRDKNERNTHGAQAEERWDPHGSVADRAMGGWPDCTSTMIFV
jgi:hypothetical protein